MDSSAVAKAESFKNQANEFFKTGKYEKAVQAYSAAIDLNPNESIYYSNRAFAYTKLEQHGAALADAQKCIDTASNMKIKIKGYYRRGSALLLLGKYKDARKDFKQIVSIDPRNQESLEKLKMCEKVIKQLAFENAIAVADEPLPSQKIALNQIEIEASYSGIHMPSPMTLDFITELLQYLKKQQKLHLKYLFSCRHVVSIEYSRYVITILLEMKKMLASLPTLLQISTPRHKLTVCGDVHGQFYDLLNIFQINGLPSETNSYLFNGDFVDRGSFSIEVIITLFALKLLYPDHIHLLRGNHESITMNKMYGFEGEVIHKYNRTVFDLFTEVFCWLPLAACIGGKILVLHGGLFSKDGVTLHDINNIARNCQPPDEGLMCELLWSDPSPFPGRSANKRGVGVAFGADVTHKFLIHNNLELLIRSHEVKEEGYLVEADGKLITVFSAPNYCDSVGNKGAVIQLDSELQPRFIQFSAVEHPPVKAMAYASNFSYFM